MVKLKNIILFIIIINGSFVFSDECRETLEKENKTDIVGCDEMGEYLYRFLLEMQKIEEYSDDYPEHKKEFDCYIRVLVKSDCEQSQQDSIRARTQYLFGVYSYLVGDLEYYRNILSNSKIILENIQVSLVKQSQDIDDEEKNKLVKKKNFISELTKDVNDSLSALKSKYADLDLYLDSDKKLEMAKVVHTDPPHKPVVININAPPDLYKDRKYRNRINYLKKFPIKFELTSYDSARGFYCKIPLVPTKKILSYRSIKPSDTYTLSFSGDKRYRFEFYRDKKGVLSQKTPKIKNTTVWKVEETLPEDWTKLKIPGDISWIYRSISTDKVIARSNKPEDHDKNNSDLIIIPLENNYIIYQKLNQKQQKMDYELIMDREEKSKWIRYLVPVVGVLTSVIMYQTI